VAILSPFEATSDVGEAIEAILVCAGAMAAAAVATEVETPLAMMWARSAGTSAAAVARP